MTMTRGIRIEVGDSRAAIVLNTIRVGSAYPEYRNFKFLIGLGARADGCGSMSLPTATISSPSVRRSRSPESLGIAAG